ncbi:MAG: hypothetical protein E7466_05440 [Ruminococcaceae bacterium]|nr:hypothetical protein [Oscillospiraceae bacterium]
MHDCSSCGGCGRDLTLTEGEIRMLEQLAQIPFLPVYRKPDSEMPIYLEECEAPLEEYGLILQCLEKKRLITLDYDKPLKNIVPAPYAIQGSMALTARGQMVVDLLERQGVEK